MLLIDQISNDKEKTLKGLEKRGFKNLGVVNEIIELNNIILELNLEKKKPLITLPIIKPA